MVVPGGVRFRISEGPTVVLGGVRFLMSEVTLQTKAQTRLVQEAQKKGGDKDVLAHNKHLTV